MMDLLRFKKFKSECQRNLPKVVDEILGAGKHENRCAIGLITTDNFYGFYVTWNFGNAIDTGEYYEWIPEMLDTSTKMFNTQKALQVFGVI